MAVGEKFDLIKACKSFFSALDWFKAGMIALKVIGIGLVILTIYKAWFEPKGGNTSNQKQKTIILGKIGTLDLRQDTSQVQKTEKSWIIGLTCDTKVSDISNKDELRAGVIVGKLF